MSQQHLVSALVYHLSHLDLWWQGFNSVVDSTLGHKKIRCCDCTYNLGLVSDTAQRNESSPVED